jgi:hypothetical protein
MDDRTINLAAKRTLQYWFVDGIVELVLGALLLLLALYFGVIAILPEDSNLGSLLLAALLLVLVVVGVVKQKLIGLLKERLTYPRTGYVAYPRQDKKRRGLTVLYTIGIGMLVAVLFASTPASLAWIPAVSGWLIGAYWLYQGHRLGLLRFYALAGISAVTGTAITLAGLGEARGLPLFYAVIGLASLVTGGFTLWAYLRQATVQPDEPGEPGERSV